MKHTAAAGAIVVATSLAPPPAGADPTRETYSPYEQETVDVALEEFGAEIDPRPVGKRIVDVQVVVLEVIEDRDPAPNFLNYLHATSKDYTITREFLFETGDRYDPIKINETERNLRGLRQLSLVVILPLKTPKRDEVKLLVIAKDVWSLRINQDFRFQNGQLELLFLQPAEENLFGTHRRAFLNFLYEPDTVSVGARFSEPRLAQSRVAYAAEANVAINHGTGEVEGTNGVLSYGQPLFSTKTPWAWGGLVSWDREITRRFVGTTLDTYDAEATPDADDAIPFRYDSDRIGGEVSVPRSLGYAIKNNFEFGAEASRGAFRAERPEGVDPAAFEEFLDEVVPFTETRNGPFLEWRFFLNQFTSVIDIETMGLQENYLLGPQLFVRSYPYLQAFGSTRDLVGYRGTAAYTHDLGGGITRVYASAGAEHDFGQGGDIADSTVQGGLRVVTPSFLIGRLVYDGTLIYRPDNFSNRLASVGGDGRLRGYPSRSFVGENLLASNLEFRSRPLSIYTVLLSGALFYDVADAFEGTTLRPKQGAGVGLRVLFPQIGRSILRFDWGFALNSPIASTPFDGLIFTFEHAYGFPRPGPGGVAVAPP
ncbi:MAG: hypothetical protein AAGA56_18420 [Myxococcota bacterium]